MLKAYLTLWRLVLRPMNRIPSESLPRVELFAALHGAGAGLLILAALTMLRG